jgi:hypothetical protein
MPLPKENLGPVYNKALEGLGFWMPIEFMNDSSGRNPRAVLAVRPV